MQNRGRVTNKSTNPSLILRLVSELWKYITTQIWDTLQKMDMNDGGVCLLLYEACFYEPMIN